MDVFYSFLLVCAAAGLAVLEIIQKEQLQSNALNVGNYLISKLRQLQIKWPNIIGDIRGSGLFIGIELTSNHQPATKETSFICMVLKDKYHILTSIDGFQDNVLVVKPPMCFSNKDVDEFVQALDLALGDLKNMAESELDGLKATPT